MVVTLGARLAYRLGMVAEHQVAGQGLGEPPYRDREAGVGWYWFPVEAKERARHGGPLEKPPHPDPHNPDNPYRVSRCSFPRKPS